ncbi:hypothetical protein [Kaistia sp. UC242_56]|uniref:hypothetical protein n=1 Tax=Kaistia sp. UC242_56 TaxID=3374625 RepID=UPI0037B9E689
MLDHKNRVADIVDCLRSAAAGADVAWSISNALDRMRYGLHGSLTPEDRDDILRAIVTAHGAALANLPVFSPAQLALGFGAMATKVMSDCQRHRELPLGASLDLHDRLRIFQSELDIVAREQDIAGRRKARANKSINVALGTASTSEAREGPENL